MWSRRPMPMPSRHSQRTGEAVRALHPIEPKSNSDQSTNLRIAPRLSRYVSHCGPKRETQANITRHMRNSAQCIIRMLVTTLLLSTGALHAQLITISGTGHFTSQDDLCSGHCSVPDIAVGTQFNFTLTYDSSTAPVVPNNWPLHIPPNQFVVSVGSHNFVARDLSCCGLGTMQISTLQPPRPGTFSAGGGNASLTYPFNIPANVHFSVVLSGPGDLFPSGPLPTTFPPLSAYTAPGFQFQLMIDRSFFGVLFFDGRLDSLTAPPRSTSKVDLTISPANLLPSLPGQPSKAVVNATVTDGNGNPLSNVIGVFSASPLDVVTSGHLHANPVAPSGSFEDPIGFQST